MTNFAYTVSDHASHASHSGNLTWVRNTTSNNLIVTDAGHNLPRKTCAGMSEIDATTKALVDVGTLTICSAPAATPPPAIPKGKPRSPKKEAPISETESASADSNGETPAEEESNSEEPPKG